MAAECLDTVRGQYAAILEDPRVKKRARKGQYPLLTEEAWEELVGKKKEGLQEFSNTVGNNLRQAGPSFLRSVRDGAWIPRMSQVMNTVPRHVYAIP